MPGPLDSAVLVRLKNQGPDFDAVIARVLETASASERAQERARWLRVAGSLVGGDPRTLGRRLHDRMVELARVSSRWIPIDVTTADGCLRAAMLIDGFGLFEHFSLVHFMTVRRALAA